MYKIGPTVWGCIFLFESIFFGWNDIEGLSSPTLSRYEGK